MTTRRSTHESARAARDEGHEHASETDLVTAEGTETGEAARGRSLRRRMSVRDTDGGYDELGGLLTGVAIGGVAIALESELLPGVLIGAGAMLLGRMFPRVAGMAGAVVRPVVKTAVGAGYSLTRGARGALAEAQEQFRDIVAEVEAERGGRRAEGHATSAAT